MTGCGFDHALTTSKVDDVDGFEMVECTGCGQLYIVEGDTFVPVSPGSLVDAGAWDGDRDGTGLMADPHWAGLDEPR